MENKFQEAFSQSLNIPAEEIKDSFHRVMDAFKKTDITPRLVTSFWFGLGESSREDIQIHLNRYLDWMGKDLAGYLSKTAGLSGSETDLKKLLKEIEAIMVPLIKQ